MAETHTGSTNITKSSLLSNKAVGFYAITSSSRAHDGDKRTVNL